MSNIHLFSLLPLPLLLLLCGPSTADISVTTLTSDPYHTLEVRASDDIIPANVSVVRVQISRPSSYATIQQDCNVTSTNGLRVALIVDLTPGTVFYIEVYLILNNSSLVSVYSTQVILDVYPVLNLTSVIREVTTLKFEWKLPVEGRWNNMHIKVWETNKGDFPFLDRNVLNTTTFIEIRDLFSGHSYDIQVELTSSYGDLNTTSLTRVNNTYTVPNPVTALSIIKSSLAPSNSALKCNWSLPKETKFKSIKISATSSFTGKNKTYFNDSNKTREIVIHDQQLGDRITVSIQVMGEDRALSTATTGSIFLLPLVPEKAVLSEKLNKLNLELTIAGTRFKGIQVLKTPKSTSKVEKIVKLWEGSGPLELGVILAGESYLVEVSTLTIENKTSQSSLSSNYTSVPLMPTEIQCLTKGEDLTLKVTTSKNTICDEVQQRCWNCINIDEEWRNASQYTYASLQVGQIYAFSTRCVVYGFTTRESNLRNASCLHKEEEKPVADIWFEYNKTEMFSLTIIWARPQVKHLKIIQYLISYIGKKKDENNHSSTKNIIVEDNASAETFKYLFSKVLYPEFNYTFMIYVEYENITVQSSDSYLMPPTGTILGPGPSNNPTIIIIVCVGIAIFLLLIVVLAGLLFIRRKKKRNSTRQMRKSVNNNVNNRQQVTRLDEFNDDSLYSDKCKLTDFGERVKKMRENSQMLYDKEFQNLQYIGDTETSQCALLPYNRDKNRFVNVLAYDRSRIHLDVVKPADQPEETDATSSASSSASDTAALEVKGDYINANWIPGYNHRKEFAVAQGPIQNTVADFWAMCWQSGIYQLVMLTKCVEKGREKCERYWPDTESEEVVYGDYQITMKSTTVGTNWTISELSLTHNNETKNIKHYHFTSWPDHGVPDNPSSLIGFVRLVRGEVKDVKTPIVVHCSAGVGRSGTFIALDFILQHIEKHDYIDVFSVVSDMRKYRKLMVQTEDQYICIHRCLLAVLVEKGVVLKTYENDAYVEDSN